MTEFEATTLTYQYAGLWVSGGVGATQCLLIGFGLWMMHRSANQRDKQHTETMADYARRHEEATAADAKRHEEAMAAISKRHEETMAVLSKGHVETMAALSKWPYRLS